MRMPLCALLFLSWIASGGEADAAENLLPPFDAGAVRAIQAAQTKSFACTEPPAPVHDLTFVGYYEPGTNSSVVNEANLAAYEAAVGTIDAFEKGVVQMGDTYIRSKPANPAVAACALTWLNTWARTQAMLGEVSQQGGYVRKWALASVSMAYVKIRDAQTLDHDMKTTVEEWIRYWAEVVRNDYSTGMNRESRRNNHSNWAGWAVMAAAVVLDDRAYFGWALDRYRAGVAQILDDGTLPLEMARRGRALHYHLYAIPPLVMMAETAARNDMDLYAEYDGALHRLVSRTVSALDNPSYFADKSGYEQEWKNRPTGGDLAWAVPYEARFPGSGLAPWITKVKRLYSTRTGGDLMLLFPKTKKIKNTR